MSCSYETLPQSDETMRIIPPRLRIAARYISRRHVLPQDEPNSCFNRPQLAMAVLEYMKAGWCSNAVIEHGALWGAGDTRHFLAGSRRV